MTTTMMMTRTTIMENDNNKYIFTNVNKLVHREEENIQIKIYTVQFD